MSFKSPSPQLKRAAQTIICLAHFKISFISFVAAFQFKAYVTFGITDELSKHWEYCNGFSEMFMEIYLLGNYGT